MESWDEAKKVSELLDKAWKNYQRPHTPQDIIETTEKGEVMWYVLKKEGEIVGAGFVKKDGELGGWVVDERERRNGFGKIIAKKSLEEAKRLGIREVYIEAVTTHIYSQKIAESLGFHPLGFLPMAVKDAPKSSDVEWTSFVVYGNYEPPLKLCERTSKLANSLGFRRKPSLPKGSKEPPAFVLFGKEYTLCKTIEEQKYAEGGGFIPLAFYPQGKILYVNPVNIDLNCRDLKEPRIKLTEAGEKAFSAVMEFFI